MAGNGGTADATAISNILVGGSATATATGGNGGAAILVATPGNGGAATANAGATNGGSAVAVAIGGSGGSACCAQVAATGELQMRLRLQPRCRAARQPRPRTQQVAARGAIIAPPIQGFPGRAWVAGAANANSSATTINGNTAQAQSTASGSSGQAQATATDQFR